MESVSKIKVKIQELNRLVVALEKEITDVCAHEFEKDMPSAPRDNGEFFHKCIKCGIQK